jgi:hypothetical protein
MDVLEGDEHVMVQNDYPKLIGQKLFIRQGGEKVVYDLSKSAARIPCGVTNPKTSVTLQKLNKVPMSHSIPSRFSNS